MIFISETEENQMGCQMSFKTLTKVSFSSEKTLTSLLQLSHLIESASGFDSLKRDTEENLVCFRNISSNVEKFKSWDGGGNSPVKNIIKKKIEHILAASESQLQVGKEGSDLPSPFLTLGFGFPA